MFTSHGIRPRLVVLVRVLVSLALASLGPVWLLHVASDLRRRLIANGDIMIVKVMAAG